MSSDFTNRPFEGLGGLLKKKVSAAKQQPKKMVVAPVEISDEEFFRQAMLQVREIKEFTQIPYYQRHIKPVRRKCSTTKDEEETLNALREIRDGKRAIDIRNTQEFIEWSNPAFKNISTVHIHEGRYSVQDFLDLHGCTLSEAELIIEEFIKESMMKGFRCVKVIHGRGLRSPNGPVLKSAIIKWLSGRLRKYVIAFTTAPQYDGGLGAMYILLKKG
ncbi:MAG: Smr/MutS family protein [Nitrospirae bacterium]|nr:Smr/MutS family protein [Nitrospirota bacterium]